MLVNAASPQIPHPHQSTPTHLLHTIPMSTLIQSLQAKWFGLTSNLCFDNGLFIVLQRLFCRQLSLLTFKKNQLTFIVDYSADDHNGIRYCLSADMYSRYYRHMDRSQPLRVLDLGANTGGFVLSLVDAGFRIEKAVSVEMNPSAFNRLKFNLDHNELTTITPLNAAATSTIGTVQIEAIKGNTGQSIYHQSTQNTLTIPTTTIDHLVASHFPESNPAAITPDLDLIKIDIEGAEYEILFSESCQSVRRFKHILIEIHPHKEFPTEKLIAALQKFGFKNTTDANTRDADVYYFQQ
ncbi:FkbM family methyltransferase [Phragmitibacter flavus]|uniref:FkbM family methyltransferase n=2 Tax=Phragmitibacter flavus TaxID=2576071 RepID=A0A5R8KG43_9BACT|nr:FkbM family methyltransferase [Phragmitibacter flavus]